MGASAANRETQATDYAEGLQVPWTPPQPFATLAPAGGPSPKAEPAAQTPSQWQTSAEVREQPAQVTPLPRTSMTHSALVADEELESAETLGITPSDPPADPLFLAEAEQPAETFALDLDAAPPPSQPRAELADDENLFRRGSLADTSAGFWPALAEVRRGVAETQRAAAELQLRYEQDHRALVYEIREARGVCGREIEDERIRAEFGLARAEADFAELRGEVEELQGTVRRQGQLIAGLLQRVGALEAAVHGAVSSGDVLRAGFERAFERKAGILEYVYSARELRAAQESTTASGIAAAEEMSYRRGRRLVLEATSRDWRSQDTEQRKERVAASEVLAQKALWRRLHQLDTHAPEP
eukprot:m51a1_g8808 hypothetical protein (357) ;mRNA; r:282233-283506